MKLKDYEENFEQRGIFLEPAVLRRFKKAIYHLDLLEEYYQRRLQQESEDWWREQIEGSTTALEINEKGEVGTGTITAAKESLARILSKNNEAERAVGVAYWMYNWLNRAGITRMRNSLNTLIRNQNKEGEPKTVRIPILSTTRDRLVRLGEITNSDLTYDFLVNQLVAFYCDMNGINLPETDHTNIRGKKAGR